MALETGSDIGRRDSHGGMGHKESFYFTTVNGHNIHTLTHTYTQTHTLYCFWSSYGELPQNPVHLQCNWIR